MAEPLYRTHTPRRERPGYNAIPTSWVRYAAHLEQMLDGLRPRRACLEGALVNVHELIAAHRNGSACTDPEAHDAWCLEVLAERARLLDLAIRQFDAALASEEIPTS